MLFALSLRRVAQALVVTAIAIACMRGSFDRFDVATSFAQGASSPIWTVPEIGALPDDANGRLIGL